MQIFERNVNENAPEEERCFLGAYLSQELDDYIRLQTFLLGKSRSDLVKELLESWKELQPGTEVICQHIANKALVFWKNKGTPKTKILPDNYSVENFVSEIVKELNKSKIPDTYISRIVEIFKSKLKNE